jgi:cytochrome c biogenesis protein CcmG/thiol:disulfide interchange protein DsbE
MRRMLPMKRLAVFLVLFAFIASCSRHEQQTHADSKSAQKTETASAATSAPEPQQGIEVGSKIPAYEAVLLDGTKFDLAKTRDHVVLVNVWATWCGPCRYETPELVALHQKYQARGFEVVGVSVDESGTESVKSFVAENKVTYPIVLDPDGKITTLFDTTVLPTSVLVDRQGRILWKKFGAIDPGDKELSQAIEKAL